MSILSMEIVQMQVNLLVKNFLMLKRKRMFSDHLHVTQRVEDVIIGVMKRGKQIQQPGKIIGERGGRTLLILKGKKFGPIVHLSIQEKVAVFHLNGGVK